MIRWAMMTQISPPVSKGLSYTNMLRDEHKARAPKIVQHTATQRDSNVSAAGKGGGEQHSTTVT